jgi:hypothetical protein
MAFYANNQSVIQSNAIVSPGQFSTRANLPTGAAGYLAFVQDQAMLTVNLGVAISTSGPDANVTWYRFLNKPNDYKNETILEQGTVANGYVNSSIYNTISRVFHATDVLQALNTTTTWTSNYGGWHSTYLYAYYHQGYNASSGALGANKQDWATLTMTTLTNRPNCNGGTLNSTQPGPKLQNTFGVINQYSAGCYLTFSNDTWTTGYGFGPGTNYGWGTFGETNGYQWNSGNSNVYKLDWTSATWTATASGNPPQGGTANLGKALPTKWGRFYHAGDSGSSQSGISIYTTANDTWASAPNSQANPQTEQCGMMSQDWGYWLGGYGPSGSWAGQNAYSQKTWYATNTTSYSSISNGVNALSSGNACWGPMP